MSKRPYEEAFESDNESKGSKNSGLLSDGTKETAIAEIEFHNKTFLKFHID